MLITISFPLHFRILHYESPRKLEAIWTEDNTSASGLCWRC